MQVRTRFAPSPTGRLHLGNARIAVFNWLFARRSGGKFILRIEDTDPERQVPGAEAGIREDLQWLGLDWDEGPDIGGPYGPYRQRPRAARHRQAIETLLKTGRAFPCFCPPGEGVADRRYVGPCRTLAPEERNRRLEKGEPHAVRFQSPNEGFVRVRDATMVGDTRFPAADLDDFVLRRTDGGYTYNFAAAVDDADMAITHVIRGSGHFSNTPKQVLVLNALAEESPVYVHMPTVLGPDGLRLAKRRGADSVEDLRALGYPPDAIVNFVSLLGWSHPEQKEFLQRHELVESASLDRLGRSEARVDPAKLLWLAERHIASEPLAELAEKTKEFADVTTLPAGSDWIATVDLLRSRLSTYADIRDRLTLLHPYEATEPSRVRPPSELATLSAVRAGLNHIGPWRARELDQAVREAGRLAGVTGATLFHPVRDALIGVGHGPPIGKLLAALGRRETLRRLDMAIG